MRRARNRGFLIWLLALALTVSGCSASARRPSNLSASRLGDRICTVVWTGPRVGNFGMAANWSTNRIPGLDDVACARRGVTIRVDRGHYVVSALIDGGELDVSGGYLSLHDNCIDSQINHVKLSGGVLNAGKGCPPGRPKGIVCIRYSPPLPPCVPSHPAALNAVRATWVKFAGLINSAAASFSLPRRVQREILAMLAGPRSCLATGQRLARSRAGQLVVCQALIRQLLTIAEYRQLGRIYNLRGDGMQASGDVVGVGNVLFQRSRAGWRITQV